MRGTRATDRDQPLEAFPRDFPQRGGADLVTDEDGVFRVFDRTTVTLFLQV